MGPGNLQHVQIEVLEFICHFQGILDFFRGVLAVFSPRLVTLSRVDQAVLAADELHHQTKRVPKSTFACPIRYLKENQIFFK